MLSFRPWAALGRAICLAIPFAAQGACAAETKSAFEIVADVPLPGDTSRFDYASLDAARHRLWIAHLGASEVLAFDTQTRQVVARIANLSQVHGVLVVPELKRVYASATGSNEVVAIDAETLAITARMPGGTYPDGMAYAPGVGKLYVSDELGDTETVIEASTNRRLATIEFGGEVGNTQYDSMSKHVFVNGQSRNELVEIDPASDRIAARIPLPGAEGSHGLLLDAPARRAWIACEDNDKLLVLDLATRKPLATFAVGHGPDVLAADPVLGRVYVASESGVVSVFDAHNGGARKLFEGFLGPNAHVVAIDPAQHLAYFPLRNVDGAPLLRIVQIAP